MNLRIGCLHAYPSGELQFETKSAEAYDDLDNEVSAVNNKRYAARNLISEK